MSKTGKKVGKGIEKNFSYFFTKVFSDFLPDLIDVYLETYDTDLLSVITDKDSLANPEYFYDEYKEALEAFEYIEDSNEFTVRTPDEGNFGFSGRLNYLLLLTEGIAGKYLELPQTDYDTLKSNKELDDKLKRVLRDLPSFFDSTTPKELRFYLLHTRGNLYKTVESILGKKLIVFPFSNSGPIYLFDDGVKFFEDNMPDLLDEAIDNTITAVKGRVN